MAGNDTFIEVTVIDGPTLEIQEETPAVEIDPARGARGPQGIQGIQGDAGADGSDGAQGVAGNDGADGSDGSQGIQGIQGDAGADGSNGTNGTDGNDGAQGPQGIQGIQGDAGADGSDGADGNDGAQGTQGIQGIQGIQGDAGADGADGASVSPIMLNCLARANSTIPENQAHDGTHKVAYSAPVVGGAPSWFALSGDGFTITLSEDGIYDLSHNTFLVATAGARSSGSARFAIGGTVEGARPATGYIRMANSQAESSSHIASHLVERSGSNITITVPLGNESAVDVTDASMAAGESTLTIKKLT